MQIGISQIIMSKVSMEEFLQSAAQAGYDVVELSMKAGGPLNGDTTADELAEIAALAAGLDLPISSMTINHCTGNLLASGADQRRSIEETKHGLAAAAKLGAPCTLHTLGSFSADLYYDDAYRNAIVALQEIGKTAASLNVELAFEFVWNGFLFSPLEVKRFLDEVGSEHIGFYFDPGNMAVFQFPQHWVRIIGSHIKRVHLKDWKGRALNGEWTPLLEGAVDFGAVMRELRNAGYAGPLISEVDPNLASLEDTLATARKIAAM